MTTRRPGTHAEARPAPVPRARRRRRVHRGPIRAGTYEGLAAAALAADAFGCLNGHRAADGPTSHAILIGVTDFVLLHGTTQSPRGWDRLVGALEDRGHTSHLVDLDSSEDRDAEAYALEVCRQVSGTVGRPVVVAHSGAGLVLPAAARALGAARQVWLAAAVPDEHHALSETMRADPAAMFNPEWVGQDPTTDPVLAAYFLFHDADLATLRWALGTLRRFVPARLYREPVATTDDIPSTYIVCTQDRTLRPDWSRREARRTKATLLEIDAGHCPHVSQPAQLAELLSDLTT